MIQKPTSGYTSEENENSMLKSYLHSHLHCNISQYRQDMEIWTQSTCPTMDERLKKVRVYVRVWEGDRVEFYLPWKGWGFSTCYQNETAGHYTKWNKPDRDTYNMTDRWNPIILITKLNSQKQKVESWLLATCGPEMMGRCQSKGASFQL